VQQEQDSQRPDSKAPQQTDTKTLAIPTQEDEEIVSGADKNFKMDKLILSIRKS
jgi:hypothetical protein